MTLAKVKSPFEYRKRNMNNSVLVVQDVKELSERIQSHAQSLINSMSLKIEQKEEKAQEEKNQ